MLVRARDGRLTLTTMRFHDEVRPTKDVPTPTKRDKPAKKEVDQAVALIEALACPWDPSRYEDRFQKRLEEDRAQEARARPSRRPSARRSRRRSPDLMAALEQTLAEIKSARRARAPRPPSARARRRARRAGSAGSATRSSGISGSPRGSPRRRRRGRPASRRRARSSRGGRCAGRGRRRGRRAAGRSSPSARGRRRCAGSSSVPIASTASATWCTMPSMTARARSARVVPRLEPEQRAARAGVPARAAEALEGGDADGARPAARQQRVELARRRQGADAREPVDRGGGGRDEALERVAGRCRRAATRTTRGCRPAGAARSLPAWASTKAPVPSVTLAVPGSQQRRPNSEACWSPAAARTGMPSIAASIASESTIGGISARGIPNRSSSSSSQSSPPSGHSSERPALPASVTWTPASRCSSHEATSP